MKSFELKLFDKYGFHKKTEWWETDLMAFRSGQNWELLTKGNYFTVNGLEFKHGPKNIHA